jgi:integrase
MSTKRYEKVKGQTGIRRNLKTNKVEAYKKIGGKTYSATFDTIIEARNWRLTYAPPEEKARSLKMTFGELIEAYRMEHLSTLALSTQGVKLDRIKIFKSLETYQVEDLSPDIITRFFQSQVNKAKGQNSRRLNFDGEIKDLTSILNWYRENYNYKFVVPMITKKLRRLCILKSEKRVKEKLTAEEFLRFFNALDPFYQDVALVQSRIAGRISEVAGPQFSCVDFNNRTLMIKNVVVYGRRKEFLELKPMPKNNEIRACFMTDDLLRVIQRRLNEKHPTSDYVFHHEGKPLKYRSVQHAYNYALKKVGLDKKTSGTHMLRHFTATLTRLVCGNLDAVQSVTGHKTSRLVEHYGVIAKTLQSESITKVEEHLREKSKEMECGWEKAGHKSDDSEGDNSKSSKGLK